MEGGSDFKTSLAWSSDFKGQPEEKGLKILKDFPSP